MYSNNKAIIIYIQITKLLLREKYVVKSEEVSVVDRIVDLEVNDAIVVIMLSDVWVGLLIVMLSVVKLVVDPKSEVWNVV